MGFGASTDPELEFDREVYPVGISLSEVAILGEELFCLRITSNWEHWRPVASLLSCWVDRMSSHRRTLSGYAYQ